MISYSTTKTGRKNDENDALAHCRDSLTGLYNDAFFKKAGLLDLVQRLPLSVIICNINGLKLVGDTLGQEKKELLLIKTASLICGCLRKKDIALRVGEDEFALLLPQTPSKTASSVVDRIQAACKRQEKALIKEALCISLPMGYATATNTKEKLSDIFSTAKKNMYKHKLLEHKHFHITLIAAIRAALYEKSHETEEHAQRMAGESMLLGKALGLSEEELESLKKLATFHDIGKISIHDRILAKPGPLDAAEWKEIKKHPETGYRIAKALPQLSAIAGDILCHHERWDGNGYPRGLRGEQIPLLARIIAVVDAFDALTSKRCYREAVSIDEALEKIMRNAGTQFDPLIAKIFINIRKKPNERAQA